MKKILVSLVWITLVFCLSTMTYGNTGKAIIPSYDISYSSSTTFFQLDTYISNITNSSISVTITYYDKNGTILTGSIFGSYNTTNFNSNLSNVSVSFDLAANATCWVTLRLNSYSNSCGYGIIDWTQNTTAVCGLIAHSSDYFVKDGMWNGFSIQINNGLPF